ncbi:hypothetical protein BST61_g6922 [Cercospora zeina]
MRTRVGDAAEHEHTPSSAATARLCALRTTLLWQLHPHRRQILLPRSSTHDDIRAANYLHPNENDPRNHPAAHEHERPCRTLGCPHTAEGATQAALRAFCYCPVCPTGMILRMSHIGRLGMETQHQT